MAALSLRLAARELRSGVRGFRIFLACLALGVAAIAAAGSTAEAFRHGLASQAREILGGDLYFSVENRDFTPDERAAFERLGTTTYTAAARAMAQARSGDRRLVSLRGVDGRFPLAGTVKIDGAPDLKAALAARPALLFADEPTGNLDAKTAATVADLMFALVAEVGAALVMVTHDPVLAERADRIVRMADGKIVA